MEVLIDHISGKQYKATGGAGSSIIVDAKKSAGGEGKGPGPMELLLISIATCSGIGIVSILEKMKVSFDKFQVSVKAEQAPEIPKVFTSIELTYWFHGDSLPEKKIDSAVSLTLDKYCPIAVMMSQVAKLTYVLELH